MSVDQSGLKFAVEPPTRPTVDVIGGTRFPVRRIFCIGKNYADHVAEMGGDAKSDPPIFFTKPADAVVHDGAAIVYPLGTENCHYEGELVIALKAGGVSLAENSDVTGMIFGYAAGCDLTRRDLQSLAKKSGNPWDTAKGFDDSAPIGPIAPVDRAGDLNDAILETRLNGTIVQSAPLSLMIWSVRELIIELSQYYELKPGDLVFTGTPAGIGPVRPGDSVNVLIGELPPLSFQIAER